LAIRIERPKPLRSRSSCSSFEEQSSRARFERFLFAADFFRRSARKEVSFETSYRRPPHFEAHADTPPLSRLELEPDLSFRTAPVLSDRCSSSLENQPPRRRASSRRSSLARHPLESLRRRGLCLRPRCEPLSRLVPRTLVAFRRTAPHESVLLSPGPHRSLARPIRPEAHRDPCSNANPFRGSRREQTALSNHLRRHGTPLKPMRHCASLSSR
jgi:hypothetical protein